MISAQLKRRGELNRCGSSKGTRMQRCRLPATGPREQQKIPRSEGQNNPKRTHLSCANEEMKGSRFSNHARKKHSEQHRTKTAIRDHEERRATCVVRSSRTKPEELPNNDFAACVLVALPHVTFDGRPLAQQPRRSTTGAAAAVPPGEKHKERRSGSVMCLATHRNRNTRKKKTCVSVSRHPNPTAMIATLRRRPAA